MGTDPLSAERIIVEGRAYWLYADGTRLPVVSGGDGSGESDAGESEDNADSESSEGEDNAEGAESAEGESEDDSDESAVPEVDQDASEEELRALYEEMDAEVEAIANGDNITPADLDRAEALRARQKEIAELITTRQTEAAELAERAKALEEEAPKLPQPVAASVITANRKPQSKTEQKSSETKAGPPKMEFLSGSDQTRVEPGTPISFDQMGEAVQSYMSTGRRGTMRLASISGWDSLSDSPEPLTQAAGASRNTQLIHESSDEWLAKHRGEQPAKTAAICDPKDPIREVPACSSDSTPVTDIFPSRPAGRLGFAFIRGMDLATLGTGEAVSVWDEEDQASVDPDDPDTWKTCLDVACATPAEVEALAVTGCIIYDNTTEISSPERIQNVLEQLSALRARAKDTSALGIIDTASPAIPSFGVGAFGNGTLPVLVDAVMTATAQGDWPNRREDPPRTMIVDTALLAAVATDQAQRAFGAICDESAALDCLRSYFGNYGIDVVRTLDGFDQGAPFVNPFDALTAGIGLPESSRVRLVTPADWIYFDTGDINVGVVRDASLVRQNKAQWFAEEYFGLAQHGCGPTISFELDLCANGARSGFVSAVCGS